MSFNKKDEDDGAIVKVDRTSVFQEGGPDETYTPQNELLLMIIPSSHIQLITNLPETMPHSVDKDRTPPLHWRKVPDQRSNHSIFQYLKVVPEQRCLLTADGLSYYQGTGEHGRGCDNGH